MENFMFHVPTKIFFGKGQLARLEKIIPAYGTRVLLTYGGGSIKQNGIYDQIVGILKSQGILYWELGGIDPNPRLESVMKGAKLCREHGIEVILAAGGGSVIDCSKVIAAARYYDGNPWDFTQDRTLVGKCLPLVTVLTMAATGTEMNRNAVISNVETNEKLGTGGSEMIPKASILDPTFTYSVSKYQTAAGAADILSHLMENYFNDTPGTEVQDQLAEGLMRSVIEYCPVAIKVPDHYDARANLMWASSLALNGLTGSGKRGSWSCHGMEHVLSAHYDITHGIGLAIITPRWMKYILNENAKVAPRFARFAKNVWQLPMGKDDTETALNGIDALYDFFVSLGIPMTLPEVGIHEEKLAEMAKQAAAGDNFVNSFVPLDEKDVEQIYKNCLTPGIS